VTAPTVEELTEDLEHYQTTMIPSQKEMDKLTLHYLHNLSVAAMLHDLYEDLENALIALDVLKATGKDLELRVADRILDGRHRGDRSTGFLTFYSSLPVEDEVTIPAGTRCYAVTSQGKKIFFDTDLVATIPIGETSVSVLASAVERGLESNVAPFTILNLWAGVAGVDSVENPLAFDGGTEDESDGELRQRYFDAVMISGRAVVEMIERHLVDVDGVTEAHVVNHGQGDIAVVLDYAGGIAQLNEDIIEALETNLAAGTQARGCLAATVTPEAVTPDLGDSFGGEVYFRARDFITAEEEIEFNYKIASGQTKVGTVTIPAGTHRGQMVKAELENEEDRAVSIPVFTYEGDNSYDILIGMGEPGYLYNLPEPVSFTVYVNINALEIVEPDLQEQITQSITNWFEDYRIGERIEYSDIRNCIVIAYAAGSDHEFLGSERPFRGINSLTCTVVGRGESVSQDGQTIDLEEDEIAKLASVEVQII
jgi:uncharacterized phage protein gp47/JayE